MDWQLREAMSVDALIVLETAVMDAAGRGHAVVTPEHLLLACLFDEGLLGTLPLGPSEAEALRERLARHLDAHYEGLGLDEATEVRIASPVEAILRRAWRQVWTGITPGAVFDAVATREGTLAAELAAGLGARAAPRGEARTTAAAERSPYRRAPDPGTVALTLASTGPMRLEHVVELAIEVLGKGSTEAVFLALTVHYKGRAPVGCFAAEDAAAIAQRARDFAAARPLAVAVFVGEPPARAETPLWLAAKRLFSARGTAAR